jgi:hypothetical protein
VGPEKRYGNMVVFTSQKGWKMLVEWEWDFSVFFWGFYMINPEPGHFPGMIPLTNHHSSDVTVRSLVTFFASTFIPSGNLT